MICLLPWRRRTPKSRLCLQILWGMQTVFVYVTIDPQGGRSSEGPFPVVEPRRLTLNEIMSSFLNCTQHVLNEWLFPSAPSFHLRTNKKVTWVFSRWESTYLGWELCAGASPPPHRPGTQRGGWAEPAGVVGGVALLCREMEPLAAALMPILFVLKGVPVPRPLCCQLGKSEVDCPSLFSILSPSFIPTLPPGL